MKLMRTLAVMAAATLLTASLASACGEKKEGASTTGTQLTSGGHAGCASKAEGTAKTVSGSGCGAKASASATTVSGSGCGSKAASAGCASKAKAGCCAKGEPVMATVADATDAAACKFKAGSVDFKGTVLCNHCNLHKSETCATMFRTESGCLFALAGEKAQALREAAVGGGKLVRVKGEVGANGELTVGTYRVIKTIDTGASAM